MVGYHINVERQFKASPYKTSCFIIHNILNMCYSDAAGGHLKLIADRLKIKILIAHHKLLDYYDNMLHGLQLAINS